MKKLKILLIVALVFGVLTLFDFMVSKSYTIEIVEVTPEVGIMDGKTPVMITVRLTNWQGEPVEGHDLEAESLTGGLWKVYRQTTDSEGKVTFEYYPYRTSKYKPVKDMEIKIRDLSNSIFIAIRTTTNLTLKMSAPEGVKK